MNLGIAARSWLSALALAAPAAQAQLPTAFDSAMDAYAHQRFRDAFDGLARLADSGHGDAARIALLMLRHGRPLYGMDFTASTQQRQHWAHTAGALAPAARQANR